MGTLFHRDGLASRALALPGRIARDVYSRAARPGPGIHVQPFSGEEVTTPAALLRLSTAILGGARDRANYEQQRSDKDLDTAFKQAEIAKMTGEPRDQSYKAEDGTVYPKLTSNEAATLAERRDAAKKSAAGTKPAADRTVKIGGTEVSGLTPAQQASTLLSQERNKKVGKLTDESLVAQRRASVASDLIASIDRNLSATGPLHEQLQAGAFNESQKLLKQIYPEGKLDATGSARRLAAIQAFGLDPRGRYSTPDDRKIVEARSKVYASTVFNSHFATVADSLQKQRAIADDVLRASMLGGKDTASQLLFLRSLSDYAPDPEE